MCLVHCPLSFISDKRDGEEEKGRKLRLIFHSYFYLCLLALFFCGVRFFVAMPVSLFLFVF